MFDKYKLDKNDPKSRGAALKRKEYLSWRMPIILLFFTNIALVQLSSDDITTTVILMCQGIIGMSYLMYLLYLDKFMPEKI